MQWSVKSTFILCNFHVCYWKNADIKDLNAFKNFNEFSMNLFSWKVGGGCTNACICIGTHSQQIFLWTTGNFYWNGEGRKLQTPRVAPNTRCWELATFTVSIEKIRPLMVHKSFCENCSICCVRMEMKISIFISIINGKSHPMNHLNDLIPTDDA